MKSHKTSSRHHRVALLTLSALALGVSSQAHAQDAAPSDDSDEIIVTAQKRAQSALDVGITLAVADQEVLEARRVEVVTDLVSFTPNVSVKDNVPGLVPVITIRG